MKKLLTPLCLVFLLGSMASVPSARASDAMRELQGLSIEELLSVEIVSASKQSSSFAQTPAAVSVITNEQIRSSGATNIPELLRLVPGLQVARLDSSRWAVSARGFNSLYSNKLLVLVDGRSVYNEIFSGVYWELLDIPLTEIERIEVIRGPGGATWGANAVNGVINILTRDAWDAQRPELAAELGSEVPEWSATARGSHQWQDAGLRLSVSHRERGAFTDEEGNETENESEITSMQGRFEWLPRAGDEVQLNVGAAEAKTFQSFAIPSLTPPFSVEDASMRDSSSQHLLAHWRRESGPEGHSVWKSQLAATRTEYDAGYFNDESLNVSGELSLQRRLSESRSLALGVGARYWRSEFEDTSVLRGPEGPQGFRLYSGFAQYDWERPGGSLRLSVGAKLEHNDFTDYEFQPSARVGWDASETTFAWAAVSRAVKTPDRTQSFLTSNVAIIPGAPLSVLLVLRPNEELDAEELTAYELGLRGRIGATASYDLSLYYHDYEDLVVNVAGAPELGEYEGFPVVLQPLLWVSSAQGSAAGLEASLNLELGRRSSLTLNYGFIDFDLDDRAEGQLALYVFGQEGTTPEHSAGARWTYRPAEGWTLGVEARYVSELEFFNQLTTFGPGVNVVPSYTEADLTIEWAPSERVRVKLIGKDLLDTRHLEFIEYTFSDSLNFVTRRAVLSAAFTF